LFRYHVSVQFCLKGRPQNDLYCVGRDVKSYSVTIIGGLIFQFNSISSILFISDHINLY